MAKIVMVVLNEECLTIDVGEDYYMLKADVLPTDADCSCLKWTSSNSNIVAVNEETGWIRGISTGTALITATAQDGSGVYDYCIVTVNPAVPVSSITLNKTSVSIEKGKTYDLNATVHPSNATYTSVTWTSTKPYVASVDGTGLVTAKSKGATWITAHATDDSGKIATCSVSVTDVPVTGVTLSPSEMTMNVGQIFKFTEDVCPPNATNKTVTWSSSNPTVASVDGISGIITALKAGTTTITVTTEDGGYQDCMTITVNYCGGSNYRDVTKHNMVLQCDGYYECSVCGYRVKSPALQDKDILNNEDYYKVLCCYLSIPYYSTLENKNNVIYIPTSTLLSKIDDIRSQSEYASKYEYAGNDGIYIREYSEQNNLIFPPLSVGYNDITSSNLWLHNGVADALVNFAFGFFVPNAYKPFFVAATSNNVYDGVSYLLSDLAQKAGYPEIGIILDLIVLGASEDDSIKVNDKVIYVSTFDGVTKIQSKFVFSSDGVLKGQYNSHKTNIIIA